MINEVNLSSAPESLQALSPLAIQISALLSANAALSAAELQKAIAKSQPSISLAIGELGDRVCKIGAARSTRYALTKDILGLPATQALHFMDEAGSISYFGELTQLQNRQIVVRANTKKQWISAAGELPWFLKTLRPQGFLGRQYLQLRPDFPGDPESWSAEQALYIAANHQSDPPGAFGIGEIIGRLVPEAPSKIDARALHYDQLAQQIGKTLPAGSSAGGEQPKFLTEVAEKNAYQHLIVKFSPPRDTPFGIRWRALLHLEHLAQTTLSAHGIAAAKARIIESPNRTYLESPRFDRIGMEGKRHVTAIDALHGEFIGAHSSRRTWLHTAAILANKKLIKRNDLSMIAKIYAFGQLIGNTDMHFGNLSFFIDDVEKPEPLLAPVYDMLPMMWRPGAHSGELNVTAVREPPKLLAYAREQTEARDWAIAFWREAALLDALDAPMKEACEESASRLRDNFR
jgi:HipA-like C-terminal domain